MPNIFAKSFAMKAMIMNEDSPDPAEHFEKALFVWIGRAPILTTSKSLNPANGSMGSSYLVLIQDQEIPKTQRLKFSRIRRRPERSYHLASGEVQAGKAERVSNQMTGARS